MKNIIFTGIGVYHPTNQRDNNFYIEHFKKSGIDVSHLINHLGRNKRYIADYEKENTLTMAYQSSISALESANTKPEEIDLLIFGTDTPEKLVPTNAMLLHDMLKTKNAHELFDLNSNCIGMLTAIDVASRLMLNNPRINKALVVGSFMGSFISSTQDPVCYSNLADASTAVILEKVEEVDLRGFIDTNFKTEPIVIDKYQFPVCGLSNMYNPDVDIEDKKLKLQPFDTKFLPKEWVSLMDVLFNRWNINCQSIKQYFFSQFSKPDAEETLQMMGVSLAKLAYTGNKYGYTGLTSPFLAYHDSLTIKKIQPGDYVMFCSVGAGYNICALLYKL